MDDLTKPGLSEQQAEKKKTCAPATPTDNDQWNKVFYKEMETSSKLKEKMA